MKDKSFLIWFAIMLSGTTWASGDAKVNVDGRVYDNVYTSINGVLSIPYNESDWHVDSHTVATYTTEKGALEFMVFRISGFTKEPFKDDRIAVTISVRVKRDQNMEEEIQQFKKTYEENLSFKVAKEQRDGLRRGIVEVMTLWKPDEPNRLLQETFVQGETGIAEIGVSTWHADLVTQDDQNAVSRLITSMIIW